LVSAKSTSGLHQFLPPAAVPLIGDWLTANKVNFKISAARSTKLGDYRHPYNGKGHRISVNHNLNPYAFLVTTVHELAHLETWKKFRGKSKPHGTEWKGLFAELMLPFLDETVLPPELIPQLSRYLQNPAASSCSDLVLMRLLSKYDLERPGIAALETLPAGTIFGLSNGRKFLKGERLRKRYRCVEEHTRKVYLFSPLAQVRPISSHLILRHPVL